MALRFLSVTRRSQYLFPKLIRESSASYRFVSDTNSKSIYKSKESKKLGIFVLTRYIQYVKNYDQVLEKRFPKAMSIYKVFMMGLQDFYRDIKEFMKIVKLVNTPGNSLKTLNRKEIELYHQMPKDMMKIAPVLIISALPLAPYVIFPLVFMYPKQLLTSQFWTAEQKQRFPVEFLKKRLENSNLLLQHIESHTCHAPLSDVALTTVLKKIEANIDITTGDVLALRPVFEHKYFTFKYMPSKQVRLLLKMHHLHLGFFRRIRLKDYATVLRSMDSAIIMEGGVHNLQTEALKKACIIRGLSPKDLSNDVMIIWLNKWMFVSKHIDDASLSLILHMPIFLGYNEPSNLDLLKE